MERLGIMCNSRVHGAFGVFLPTIVRTDILIVTLRNIFQSITYETPESLHHITITITITVSKPP